jgi:hypothetical protein
LKKLAISLFIIIALTLAIPLNIAFGQDRTVGVSVGDTFKYNYNLDFNVNNSSDLTLPSYIEQLFDQAKAIEWAQITITNVSGTQVTAHTLLHYNNGTEQASTQSTDVATGQDNMSMFLIAANLNQNDPIYPDQMSQTINETVTRNYPSGDRQLNHQSMIMNYNVTQDEMQGFNMSDFMQQNREDIYWDRQLGVLVEMSYNMVTQSPVLNANITMNLTLTESNVLTVPEFPTFIPIFIIAAATIAVVAFVKTRTKKLKN